MSDQNRRGYYPLAAVNPTDGTTWKVYLSEIRVGWVAKQGRRAVMWLKTCVPETLARPCAVFAGIRQDEDEKGSDLPGWLCYVGRPPQDYDINGRLRPAPEGMVFVVFVNADRVAYGWRWDPAAPDDARCPIDHASRFKHKVM